MSEEINKEQSEDFQTFETDSEIMAGSDVESQEVGQETSCSDEPGESAVELSEAYSHVIKDQNDGQESDNMDHDSTIEDSETGSEKTPEMATDSDRSDVEEPGTAPNEEPLVESTVEVVDQVEEVESDNGGPDDSASDESEGDVEISDTEQAEDEEVPEDGDPVEQEITTCSVVEAILFAADEPVGLRKIVEIIDAGGIKEVKKHIRDLNKKYRKMGCAFRIEELAGGYQMLTRSAYNPWLSKLIKVRSETKLTSAAMETLAIIAYKQPIMRVEIENIRGVAAGEMIRQLIEKGLVKITGRAEELGRPLLYGTTQKFLDIFGLATLKDLPQPESVKK